MKSKAILFFLLLSALIPQAWAADFGEDEDYLGQVIDDYENDNNIAAMIDTINNETLNCMELNFSGTQQIPQNFTLYTEVEEGNEINIVNATYADITLSRGKTSYAWFDMGVDALDDFNLYGVFRLDYHNLNGWGAYCFMTNDIESEQDHRANDDPFIAWTISGSNGDIQAAEHDTSGVWHMSGGAVTVIDDTFYWIKFEKTGTLLEFDIYTTKALRDAEGNGDFYDGQIVLQEDYSFRYLMLCQSHDDSRTEVENVELYNLAFITSGYSAIGTYYTVNVLDGDPAIAILYNLTISAGCGATMEFSTDNFTWVDHNNQAGSDTLIAGYENLDLRDIYNGTTYRRVNMTSNGEDTPRMYQERFVTVTTIAPSGGGLFPGLAIGISLLIIGAIYAMEKRR